MRRRTGLIHTAPASFMPLFSARMGTSSWRAAQSVDWHSAVKSWPVLRNADEPGGPPALGDCVAAGMLHAAQLHMANAWASSWQPSDQQAVDVYSAISGYDPATGQPDNGADPNKAFSWWTQTGMDLGLQARNVVLPLVLDVANTEHLSLATELLGFVGLCLNLPASMEDADNDVMDVPPSGVASAAGMPGGMGAHFVVSGRYAGGARYVISWGHEWEITPAFLAAYGIGAYSGFSPAWVDDMGISPEGISRAALMQDLQRLAA